MRSIIILMGLIVFPLASIAQNIPTLQELMSSSEFRQAGLNKLSDAEMKKLNEWMANYTKQIFEFASSQSPTATQNVIESRIEGEFTGWEGETIFKLDNGQIWQQSQYAYHYHYAYRPKVTIVKTNNSYKMTVEGVRQSINVKRIR